MDRDGLADFLRRRREVLQPDDVGLTAGRRRRTSGLRREEVAALAHMSTDFYARIEQRRGSRPSAETVGALARALRLTLEERDHLFLLAGHPAPPRGMRGDHVTPALLRVLDRLDTPAHVVSDLGVTLAQNPLGEALFGPRTGGTGLGRSVFYRWFTDPAERALFVPEDHGLHRQERSTRHSPRCDLSGCSRRTRTPTSASSPAKIVVTCGSSLRRLRSSTRPHSGWRRTAATRPGGS